MSQWPVKLRIGLCLAVYIIWTLMCWVPLSGIDGVDLINDKLAHFIANMGLVGALLLAFTSLPKLAVFIGVGLHSFLIEVVQYFIPGRFFSLADMLANVLGVLAGCVW